MPGTAILGVALCVGAQAFFVGGELALLGADRLALAERARSGHTGSALAVRLLEKERRLNTACLIGSTTAVVAATTLATLAFSAAGDASPSLAFAAVFPFTLLLGSAVPRRLGTGHADLLAPLLAWPLFVSQTLFQPLLWLAERWVTWVERAIGAATVAPVTREEILSLLADPDIPDAEQRLIRGVFEIRDTVVEEVMTPLVQVDALPCTASVREAVEAALRTGFSRIPVFRDRVDNLVGVVSASDLLFQTKSGAELQDLMRPVLYVPETQRVDALLDQMRDTRSAFAVVVDEYGGSVGVVTVEDVLEEIVGEIGDERDVETPGITRLADNTWRVPGHTEVWALQEHIGQPLPEGDYETISGLILARTGRIPKTGEVVLVNERVALRVEYATDRAILWVKVTLRA